MIHAGDRTAAPVPCGASVQRDTAVALLLDNNKRVDVLSWRRLALSNPTAAWCTVKG